MSKTNKTTAREYDFINYRLDAIEKRMDNIETAVRSRSDPNSDPNLVHILLELLKKDREATTAPTAHAVTAQMQQQQQQEPCDRIESNSSHLDAFTTLLARRRAMA